MSTSRINIQDYQNAFTCYPSDFVAFVSANNIVLPRINSMSGQALALMSQPEVRGQKHLEKDDVFAFLKNVGMATSNAVFHFKQTRGLDKIKARGKYCLKYPFSCELMKDSIGGVNRNSQINMIKNWWKKNVIDVPNDEWHADLLDPTKNDRTENNMAYRAPIQLKYKDRFKFDSIFMKMWPTATELVPNFDEFYSEKEQKLIYESLKQKFDKPGH